MILTLQDNLNVGIVAVVEFCEDWYADEKTKRIYILVRMIVRILLILLLFASCNGTKKVTETISVAEFETIKEKTIITNDSIFKSLKTDLNDFKEIVKIDSSNFDFNVHFNTDESGEAEINVNGVNLKVKKTGNGQVNVTGNTNVKNQNINTSEKKTKTEDAKFTKRKTEETEAERQASKNAKRINEEKTKERSLLGLLVRKWWFWIILLLLILYVYIRIVT